VIGVAAVVGDPRDPAVDAADHVAATAGVAVPAVPAEPADTDPPADLPRDDPLADGLDAPGDLVPGHDGVLDGRHRTLDGERVGVAHPACLDPDEDLAAGGSGDLALGELEALARGRDLDDA
jgi:hypothetical protein